MKKTIALLFTAILLVTLMATALAARDPATCPHVHCGWKHITPATYEHGGVDWWVCQDCGKALYFRNTPKLTYHTYHGQTVTGPGSHDNCGHDHNP